MLPLKEPTLAELLSEPIVRKLMARDRVSDHQVCAIAVAARCRIENAQTGGRLPLAYTAANSHRQTGGALPARQGM